MPSLYFAKIFRQTSQRTPQSPMAGSQMCSAGPRLDLAHAGASAQSDVAHAGASAQARAEPDLCPGTRALQPVPGPPQGSGARRRKLHSCGHVPLGVPTSLCLPLSRFGLAFSPLKLRLRGGRTLLPADETCGQQVTCLKPSVTNRSLSSLVGVRRQLWEHVRLGVCGFPAQHKPRRNQLKRVE